MPEDRYGPRSEPAFLERLAAPDMPRTLPEARPPLRSGWLIGIVVGVLAMVLAVPPVRFMLGSQLQFTFAEESVPFIRALDDNRRVREAYRLDAAAAAAPDDYLLQVGRATALATAGGLRETRPGASSHASDADRDVSDHTLFRLQEVARDFPLVPGAYAHLARYLMIDRVRMSPSPTETPLSTPGSHNRSLLPPDTAAPSARDVSLMEWALLSGARCDPDNAFWPTMLATTYFAVGRDIDGLAALTRASRLRRWDAYIYEEILGQWRLYSAAYGDNGATQQIGPLSLVAFPHLREIRRMAEHVRDLAEQKAAEGQVMEAIRIRRNLTWVGVVMRETAQWSYEALIGTDVSIIASTDGGARMPAGILFTVGEWEKEAANYLALLHRFHRKFDLAFLY